MGDYGTTNYKGKNYQVTCDAWVCNKGTNGDVVYIACATKDDKKYKVQWNTTEKWNLSCELLDLEEKLSDTHRSYDELFYISERIKELESQGINSIYARDNSNSCDWDNVDEIWEMEE